MPSVFRIANFVNFFKGKDSWDKVCTYLDLSSDPKRNNLVCLHPDYLLSLRLIWLAQVSRMKSVLIAVKTNPPASAKNFGA